LQDFFQVFGNFFVLCAFVAKNPPARARIQIPAKAGTQMSFLNKSPVILNEVKELQKLSLINNP
jgi:hypothetical protein